MTQILVINFVFSFFVLLNNINFRFLNGNQYGLTEGKKSFSNRYFVYFEDDVFNSLISICLMMKTEHV